MPPLSADKIAVPPAKSQRYSQLQASMKDSCSLPKITQRSSIDIVEHFGLAAKETRSLISERRLQETRTVDSEATYRLSGAILSGNACRETRRRWRKNTKAKSARMPSLGSILRTVWPSLDREGRMHLLLGVLACLVAAGSTSAFSFFFANLLESFWIPNNRASAGSKWAGALAAIAVVDATSTFLSFFFMEHAANKWIDSLRSEAFKRILAQPKSWFDKENHSPGTIVECLDRNAEETRKLVGMFLPISITVLLMISTSLVWALTIKWDLTLVALAGLPLAVGDC